jgi:hypothetical protein
MQCSAEKASRVMQMKTPTPANACLSQFDERNEISRSLDARRAVPRRLTHLEGAIRLCAYRKWVTAGKPSGDGVNFWLEAKRELSQAK